MSNPDTPLPAEPESEDALEPGASAPAPAAAPASASASASASERSVDDTLSPSVRRLVRQYSVDITGIHGSGPEGRIRVSDVMAALGGGEATLRGSESGLDEMRAGGPPTRSNDSAAAAGDTGAYASEASGAYSAPFPETAAAAAHGSASVEPATCVFECDLGRVLAHQKSARNQGEAYALTSYFVRAGADALHRLGAPTASAIGVVLTDCNGALTAGTLENLADRPFASLNEAIAALEARASAAPATDEKPRDEAAPSIALVVHHHGASGSLLTVPTPLGPGQLASLGVGKVRRIVTVKTVNGQETPRVAAECYLSLTFDAAKLDYSQANRFLGDCVRRLERWPANGTESGDAPSEAPAAAP
jgi:pyruvate/2-oxoglutarate dehydrogenase complex dihydrolipoamide acyltransferase (E2) component